jgi:hypothetical protein
MTRPIRSFAEEDVFTSWRTYYCYTQRAGTCAKIKRQYRRRERRQGKKEAAARALD